MAKMEDNQLENDQNGKLPKWKTTKMEDDQNGRWPELKTPTPVNSNQINQSKMEDS